MSQELETSSIKAETEDLDPNDSGNVAAEREFEIRPRRSYRLRILRKDKDPLTDSDEDSNANAEDDFEMNDDEDWVPETQDWKDEGITRSEEDDDAVAIKPWKITK